MLLMKTKGIKDIWEKDGIAPFKSKFIGSELSKIESVKLPIKAIGFYSKNQTNKTISLLKVHQIEIVSNSTNDVLIHFKFERKLPIVSKEFDLEIVKISKNLFSCQKDDYIQSIINNLKINNKPTSINKVERFLSAYFYDDTDWKNYEIKISQLFIMLGFDVQLKGHQNEMERVSDLYCYSPPQIESNKFCIIIDCKNINDYSIIAKDERAMKEYIENEKSIAFKKGIKNKNVFFLFIAHGFTDYSFKQLKEIAKSTNTYGALISTDNILYLTEKRLKLGYKMYLEYFPKLFKNQIVNKKLINDTYN